MVYKGEEIKNLSELKVRIYEAVKSFNETKTGYVDTLYMSMPSRLVTIITKRGDRIKY